MGGAFWLPIGDGDTALMSLSGVVPIPFGIVIFARPGTGALVTLGVIVVFALVAGVTQLSVAIGGTRLLVGGLKGVFESKTKPQPSC